ncbi:glycosyltransferase [Hymenobacter sp. BT175]|uniref:glycosyltransferase n=1 Tax=Hymenobacter translucens TaxID=2886507 RepID=UPI001D0E1C47|nr:glycosyltransferase [Hymenobacter translucens]MCC2547643.1 glycosyltransferase [Hymenobacter translucens]
MISLIICTLNEEKYLPMLLDSIEIQQGPFEVIVVDGNSTDNTAKVVQNYAQRSSEPVQLVTMEEAGLSNQRNKGVEKAKYEHLLFLDADVVLPAGFLKDSLTQIKNKDIPFAGTKIYAAEPGRTYRITYYMYSHYYLPLMRLFNPVIHGCSIFTTKEMHYKIGGFQQDVTFEDFRYSKMAAQYYRPVLLKNIYVRTSARRFYNATPRELAELVVSGLYSLFKAGMDGKSFMKKFHENYGKHGTPKY